MIFRMMCGVFIFIYGVLKVKHQVPSMRTHQIVQIECVIFANIWK